jgi:hypothetical protein
MPALRCYGKGCPGGTWKGYRDSLLFTKSLSFFHSFPEEEKGQKIGMIGAPVLPFF